MDHSKLDASLVAALEGAEPAAAAAASQALSVFVHLKPRVSKAEKEKLAELGLTLGSASSAQGGIATATLSPEQVRQLSECPAVRHLRLSVPLRMLGGESGLGALEGLGERLPDL